MLSADRYECLSDVYLHIIAKTANFAYRIQAY